MRIIIALILFLLMGFLSGIIALIENKNEIIKPILLGLIALIYYIYLRILL